MAFNELFNDWWTKLFFLLLRPVYKLIFKWLTGKCELLRIAYSHSRQVDRVNDVEWSLRQSKSAELKACVVNTDYSVSESVTRIQTLKNIDIESYPQFEISLTDSLQRIQAYNKVISQAESLRTIKFSSENAEHEEKLVKLWSLYNNGKELPSRTGNHWTNIGFQGDDPGTDFRGMGLLGLDQLIFFAETYPQEAQQVLSLSHHPQFGFSFAILGINMTEMGYTLLTKRKLKAYFYDLEKPVPDIVDFHHVYCHILHGFALQWISERPKDIMEFSTVREKYLGIVKEMLQAQDNSMLLKFQHSVSPS